MEDSKSNFKLLKLQVIISGEIIKGKMPNLYSYNENTDLSSNLSNFYIPTQAKLIGRKKFNYKDLLDKEKVNLIPRDYSIRNTKLQLMENVRFLVKQIFNTNNVFYVKCQPYIITDKSQLTINNERELFIKNTRKKYKNIKDLIKEDNKNKIKEFKEHLLEMGDNKTLTDEDNIDIRTKQKVLLVKLEKENVEMYINTKKKELIEESNKLHYNLDFTLNKSKNGIDVKDKSDNEIYLSIILNLTNKENISKIKYHKNCTDNYQQINNMWKQFCSGPNGYIEKMEKIRIKDIQKNYNPKNNLLYLMCRDKIPKKYTYIKHKPIDINKLQSKCSIRGGKLGKTRKYYKKKRTTMKLQVKKNKQANKNTRIHNEKRRTKKSL